jgi:exonuclease III
MEKKHLDRVNEVDYLQDQMGSDHCPMAIEVN